MQALLLLSCWISLTVCIPLADNPRNRRQACADDVKNACVTTCKENDMTPKPGEECDPCTCVNPCDLVQCQDEELCIVQDDGQGWIACASPPCKLEAKCEVTACPDGFWGTTCNKACYKYCATCEKSSGKCIFCKDGYFEYENNCDYECTGCKERCDRVDGICFGDCVVAKYGEKCDKACPVNCSNGCDKVTGDCIFGCVHGYGLKCDELCPSTCLTPCFKSGEINGRICEVCKTDWWGPNCQKKCYEICLLGCDKHNGRCNQCPDGFFTSFCDKECYGNCKAGCDKVTAKCFGCNFGYYGKRCTEECPKNCRKGCGKDGTCNMAQCIEGFYGDRCETPCSPHCSSKFCTADYCECDEGWAGSTCSQCQRGYFGTDCHPCPCGRLCDHDGNCPDPNAAPTTVPPTILHRKTTPGGTTVTAQQQTAEEGANGTWLIVIVSMSIILIIGTISLGVIGVMYRNVLKKEQQTDQQQLLQDDRIR